jgi:hypothetical protein
MKWQTPEIQEKIRERRKGARTFQQNLTTEDLITKGKKTRTRRAIKATNHHIQNNRPYSMGKNRKNIWENKITQHQ